MAYQAYLLLSGAHGMLNLDLQKMVYDIITFLGRNSPRCPVLNFRLCLQQHHLSIKMAGLQYISMQQNKETLRM